MGRRFSQMNADWLGELASSEALCKSHSREGGSPETFILNSRLRGDEALFKNGPPGDEVAGL